MNRLIRVSFGPFQLGELPEGEVDEVRTRVLRDQLGEELSELAGVEFDRPVFEKIGEREERGRKGRPEGRGEARGGRFGDREERGKRFGRDDDRGGRFGRDRDDRGGGRFSRDRDDRGPSRFGRDRDEGERGGKTPEHRFGNRPRVWRDGEATDFGPRHKAVRPTRGPAAARKPASATSSVARR